MGRRWPAAVKALSMAMETEVSFARGMRVKCRRWRVESTRAMLKSEGGGVLVGWLMRSWKVGLWMRRGLAVRGIMIGLSR